MCTFAERARRLGREARILRQGVGECPFVFGDPEAFHWVAGWNEEDQECIQVVRAYDVQSMRERMQRK